MSQLTEDRICDLQDIFNLFDEKGDGKISAYHLGEVLRAMGENPTQAEVKKCGYEGRETGEMKKSARRTIKGYYDDLTPEPQIEKKDMKKPAPPSKGRADFAAKKDTKKPAPPSSTTTTTTTTNTTTPSMTKVERLSFEIVLPIMQTISRNKPLVTYDDLVEGFRVFDKDQNGIVSSAEMRHLLTGLGERLSPEEADQLLQGIEDNQGNINYEELIRIVMSS